MKTKARILFAMIGAWGFLNPNNATAQITIEMPMVSQHATVSQRVGTTDFKVIYHRPAVNDREIWGELVPYDVVWRAGANENTVFQTEHDVVINGNTLPAGSYGLHMIPQKGNWTVIFSKKDDIWGSFAYQEKNDALRVEVTPVEVETFTEHLSYSFIDVQKSSCVMALHWANLQIAVPLEVDVKSNCIADLKQRLADTTGLIWNDYYIAARYCLYADTLLQQAADWADVSMQIDTNFYTVWMRSRVARGLNDEAIASQLEEKVRSLATASNYSLVVRVHINEEDYDKALEWAEYGVENHKDSWVSYHNIAKVYGLKNEKQKALKNYKKALKLAPEDRIEYVEGKIEELKESSS